MQCFLGAEGVGEGEEGGGGIGCVGGEGGIAGGFADGGEEGDVGGEVCGVLDHVGS